MKTDSVIDKNVINKNIIQEKASKQIINRPMTKAEQIRVEKLYASLLEEMKKNGHTDSGLVWRAYKYALQKYGHKRRLTESPYIVHALAVAKILAESGYNSEMIAAALLHDMMEICDVLFYQLEKEFGTSIADTVNGVTNVVEYFTSDSMVSAKEMTSLSDVRFMTEHLEEHTKRAIYIKCAERIHNLRTIDVFPRKQQMEKAKHTRNVIIPAAKALHAHMLAEILGNLCLQIENEQVYSAIQEGYRKLLKQNEYALFGVDKFIGLDAFIKKMLLEHGRMGKKVIFFDWKERSEDNIYEELILKLGEEANLEEIKKGFVKQNVALYDLYFVTKDETKETPEEIFFYFYKKLHASTHRLTITGIDCLDDGVVFYNMSDRFGTRYRLFVHSEKEHLEFIHGIIKQVKKQSQLGMQYGADCEEFEYRKIRVFKKDGSPMWIKDGATVLDFAFSINPNIGICAKYAHLNGNTTQVPVYTRLQPGDMIEIVSDHDRENPTQDIPHAMIRWFEYLHTREAIKSLSRWLEKHVYLEER